MIQQPIIIESSFNAPIEKVWKALTENEDLKRWYFQFQTFRPEVGFEFHFNAGTEEKSYLHLCKITAVVPREKLEYTWRYDGFEGNSIVTFQLFDEGEKTKIMLTHKGLETFPASNPDFAKKNFEEGWKQIIGKNLKEFIEG